MNGWQEPKDGKRIYIITDNTKMNGFIDYIKSEDVDRLYVTYSESRVNLGIHYYRNKLYTSNLVGICRIKSVDNETLYDAEGNELLIKVIPRFNVKIVELLNYMRDDDEFDRYMAPQTISNRHKERDIEAIDRNEIFYFFGNENPLKVDDKISGENSIIRYAINDLYSFSNISDFYMEDYENLKTIYEGIKPDDQQYDLIKKKNVELLKVIIGRKMELLRPKSIDGN